MKLIAESTVFNDAAVQNKFSELVVDADGIRTEVGKKVGNNEVISRINQSAESVSIDAGKVNISGVITAINNNTTTTIDGDKITTGTLSASAVDANSGTFNSANIPNLNADKITTGTINIGRIPSTARNDTYITDISGTGIYISPANQSPSSGAEGNSVKIDGSGMNVYKGGTSVAEYGDKARIGRKDQSYVEVDSNGLTVKYPTSYYNIAATLAGYGTDSSNGSSLGTLVLGNNYYRSSLEGAYSGSSKTYDLRMYASTAGSALATIVMMARNDSKSQNINISSNYISSSSTIQISSDRRLKEHIKYLDEDAVAFVQKLKPVLFRKDDYVHTGFYAQDVEEADKWNALTVQNGDMKSLDYMGLIAPLVAYCQHLEKRIEELERSK